MQNLHFAAYQFSSMTPWTQPKVKKLYIYCTIFLPFEKISFLKLFYSNIWEKEQYLLTLSVYFNTKRQKMHNPCCIFVFTYQIFIRSRSWKKCGEIDTKIHRNFLLNLKFFNYNYVDLGFSEPGFWAWHTIHLEKTFFSKSIKDNCFK